jgi:D-alanyl-D-alanine carboxypeptidase
LQEQGKLSVDDAITKHLKSYPADPGDRITIHQLLTHTSGIPSYTDDAELMARRTVEIPAAELVVTFQDRPLEFAPGTEWRYSNSGYVLLGLVVEAASGQSYEQYLQEHFFTPLGLTGTGYTHNETILPLRASGYTLTDGVLANAAHIAMSLPFSAGAIHSTVGDLAAWDRALHGDKVLSAASQQQMFTPVQQNYGYGVMMMERSGHKLIMHDGGIDGFSSHLARYPDDGVTIVVLGNNESVNASELGFALAAIMFDQPYDVPVRKTPVAVADAALDEFGGVYRVGEDQYRVFRRDGQGLTSRRTGGAILKLLPESADRFYYTHDNASTVTFVRDAQGAVVAHVMHQQGVDSRHEKLVGAVADSIMALQSEVVVDPAVFARYVGDYELAPGFVLTFRTRDGRFFTQATGQSELEVFAAGETEYFLKAVDARLSFTVTAGAVTGVVLHQNGRDMPGPKIR